MSAMLNIKYAFFYLQSTKCKWSQNITENTIVDNRINVFACTVEVGKHIF
jgi:hypothetical protein